VIAWVMAILAALSIFLSSLPDHSESAVDSWHDLEVTLDLDRLAAELREFVRERDWEQFHSPKNLVLALTGEVGELAAEFQWLTAEQSESHSLDDSQRLSIENEIADVLIYLVRLADTLDVDVDEAVGRKLQANKARYTVERSHGSSAKVPRRDSDQHGPAL
jgi:dCTP diphosphatase